MTTSGIVADEAMKEKVERYEESTDAELRKGNGELPPDSNDVDSVKIEDEVDEVRRLTTNFSCDADEAALPLTTFIWIILRG